MPRPGDEQPKNPFKHLAPELMEQIDRWRQDAMRTSPLRLLDALAGCGDLVFKSLMHEWKKPSSAREAMRGELLKRSQPATLATGEEVSLVHVPDGDDGEYRELLFADTLGLSDPLLVGFYNELSDRYTSVLGALDIKDGDRYTLPNGDYVAANMDTKFSLLLPIINLENGQSSWRRFYELAGAGGLQLVQYEREDVNDPGESTRTPTDWTVLDLRPTVAEEQAPDAKDPTELLEATAYHEAGHAVAGYVLGYQIESVSVIPDKERGSLGRVYFREQQWARSQRIRTRQLRNELAHLLAGGIAEDRKTGVYNGDGASGDVNDAIDLAQAIAGDIYVAERAANQAWAIAEALIAAHWPAVEALAGALIGQRELDGNQATTIIAPLATAPGAWIWRAHRVPKKVDFGLDEETMA